MTSCTIVTSRDPFRRPWVHIDGHWQRPTRIAATLAVRSERWWDGSLNTGHSLEHPSTTTTVTTRAGTFRTTAAPAYTRRPSGRTVQHFPSVTPLPRPDGEHGETALSRG